MQTQQYKMVRVTGDGGVCSEGRIMRVILFGGTNATSIILTGTATLDVNTPANTSIDLDFTKLGGIWFDTDVEADITGTNAVALIFCDAGAHV